MRLLQASSAASSVLGIGGLSATISSVVGRALRKGGLGGRDCTACPALRVIRRAAQALLGAQASAGQRHVRGTLERREAEGDTC